MSDDYLLTTATAKATTFIKFIPDLDYEKQEAFRRVHYIGATKIALIFQRPFWEDDDIFEGGRTFTDLPSRSIYYPSHGFDSGLGVLIASYKAGPPSDLFLGLSEEECLNQTLDDLAEIHGNIYEKSTWKELSKDGAWIRLVMEQ